MTWEALLTSMLGCMADDWGVGNLLSLVRETCTDGRKSFSPLGSAWLPQAVPRAELTSTRGATPRTSTITTRHFSTTKKP